MSQEPFIGKTTELARDHRETQADILRIMNELWDHLNTASRQIAALNVDAGTVIHNLPEDIKYRDGNCKGYTTLHDLAVERGYPGHDTHAAWECKDSFWEICRQAGTRA